MVLTGPAPPRLPTADRPHAERARHGLSALAEIACPARGRTLHLVRSWPRADDHLLLEYRDGDVTVAGQWFADPDRASAVARQTDAVAPGHVTVVGGSGVVLQAGGADRRLPALAGAVRQPGSELVVHRPERRAVVRVTAGGGGATTYRKFGRPGRTSRPPDGRRVGGVRVPDVIAHDDAAGILELAELPGRPLHELLGDPEASDGEVVAAFQATGEALRALHAAEPAPGLPGHDAAAEWRVAQRWVDHAVAHEVLPRAAVASVRAALEDLGVRLGRREHQGHATLVHRDLHDKQVLVAEGHDVGVLDLDTLAVGDPALDLANLLVHLELRVLQGRCGPERAVEARSALLDGYRPTPAVSDGLDAYSAATRLRLACLYAFRPRWQDRAVRLVEPSRAV